MKRIYYLFFFIKLAIFFSPNAVSQPRKMDASFKFPLQRLKNWQGPALVSKENQLYTLSSLGELTPLSNPRRSVFKGYSFIRNYGNDQPAWFDSMNVKLISVDINGHVEGPFPKPTGFQNIIGKKGCWAQVNNKAVYFPDLADTTQKKTWDFQKGEWPLTDGNFFLSWNNKTLKVGRFGKETLLVDTILEGVFENFSNPRFTANGIFLRQSSLTNSKFLLFDTLGFKGEMPYYFELIKSRNDSLFFLRSDTLLIKPINGPMIQKFLWGDVESVRSVQNPKNWRRGFSVEAIFGDSLAYLNLLSENEKPINNTSTNGLYRLDLRTLEIRAAQSPAYPNFSLEGYSIFNNKVYFFSPTPKNGAQVLRYDFETKKTEILSDFPRLERPSALFITYKNILVRTSVSGRSDSTNIYKIDPDFTYSWKEIEPWEKGYIHNPFNGFDKDFGDIHPVAIKLDKWGNLYHLLDLPNAENVYRITSENNLAGLNSRDSVINPFRINVLDKFGPDGKLKWSKRFLAASGYYFRKSRFEVNELGQISLSGISDNFFRFDDPVIFRNNKTISYHILADSNGNQLKTVVNSDFDNVLFEASSVDDKGNLFLAAASYDQFQLGGITIRSSFKTSYSKRCLTLNKLDNNRSLVWTFEVDIADFSEAETKWVRFDQKRNCIFALVTGKIRQVPVGNNQPKNLRKAIVLCLSATDGTLIWKKEFEGSKELEWAGFSDFNSSRMLLVGHFYGDLFFEGNKILKGDSLEEQPFWIQIDKSSGRGYSPIKIDKLGFLATDFEVNEDQEIFLTSQGARLNAQGKRERFVDYEKYSWNGHLKQKQSLPISFFRGTFDWPLYTKFALKNKNEMMVVDYSDWEGFENIAFSTTPHWNFRNIVMYPRLFNPENDLSGANSLPGNQSVFFPNPHSEEFYLQHPDFESIEALEFDVYDVLGRSVGQQQNKLTPDTFVFRLPNTNQGLYFFRYTLPGTGEKKVARIIKN